MTQDQYVIRRKLNILELGKTLGNIYVADRINNRLRKIAPPLPEFNQQGFQIVSEDGTELYGFDFSGRHLQTLNTTTGASIWTFAYNSAGQLISATDGDGDVTTIQRDVDGNPTAIVSADGQTTILALNGNGFLSGITNPANETNLFTYTPEGLMTKRTDPRLNDHLFTYDIQGRLETDSDPAGGSQTLARTGTNENYTVTNTTGLGRAYSFSYELLDAGSKNLRTTTDPSGFSTTTLLGTDQSKTITTPDGTQTVITSKPDPRFGMQAPFTNLNVTTPGGLVSNLTTTRSVTLSDPANPLSLTTQTDTTSFNGRTIQSIFDKSLNTMTNISPEGRQFANVFDDQGRVSKEIVPGIADRSFEPDIRGRLSAIRQGTGASERLNTVAYNPQGFVDSLTDPLGRSNRFEYDSIGRVTKQILPDLREIVSTYDVNGNVTSITPPGRPAHVFTYTPVNLESSYTPPNVGLPQHATNFTYNVDRQLTQITRPDGKTVVFSYDTGGRRASVQIPRGLTFYGYDPLTGQLTTITAPDGGALTFTYDGRFRLSSTWAGAVSGSVSRTFNNDQQIASRSVNGASTVSFTYDQDELVTQAGALNLQYNANNMLVSESTLGLVTDNLTYNEFGEVETYTAQVNANPMFSQQFTYDKLGRIVEKTETVQGITHVFTYVYNSVDFLTQVWRDSVLISQYNYDSNGNRAGGTYDDQDRLLNFGTATYTYTANGELLTKTDPSGTTNFNYDVLGNLITVTLPSGNVIEYVYDGQNRRIGKKVDGVLEKGWLYKDGFNQIAELDGSGNVVSRFVYGTRNNVPAYMIKGGNIYRIVTDILGSPRMVIETATGVMIQSMDYDEWGNVTTDTNPGFQPFGFAGGLYDPDTNLVQFGFRDYDANTGRWTSKDPIRFDGNDTNLYGYILNDPINLTDPLGLYGTKSCKLYDDLAEKYGGSYFKDFARPACNTFPKGETDDKSFFTNRSNCIRQCLQEQASLREFAGEFCRKDPPTIFDLGFTLNHIGCYSLCTVNPENPYNPLGPNLPDRDIGSPISPNSGSVK